MVTYLSHLRRLPECTEGERTEGVGVAVSRDSNLSRLCASSTGMEFAIAAFEDTPMWSAVTQVAGPLNQGAI
jgi:hypothetical protein